MFAYKMIPYYSHGITTPWGGDALRRVFHKPIPDDHTGEAWEASTVKDKESRAVDGRTLAQVAGGPLPLLLKLLDAREALSVQVHPDDAYARAHGGVRGKTEAWLILHAEPGARLVYGLLPEVDLKAVKGREIEKYLRWVEVQAGDALYIPAGMVHAIGPGILLYEIQQASDITYRFWDWARPGVDGELRPLHWDDACAVAKPCLQLAPTRGETSPCPGGEHTKYFDTEYFTLDAYTVAEEMPLPRRAGFQYLTALCPLSLEKEGEAVALAAGETAYIPPAQAGIVMRGAGRVLVSGEGLLR